MSNPDDDWAAAQAAAPRACGYGYQPPAAPARSAAWTPSTTFGGVTSVSSVDEPAHGTIPVDGPPPAPSTHPVESSPLGLLAAALAVVVVAAGVAFGLGGGTGGIIAWVLAGPIAVLLVGAFLVTDGRRRGTGWYRPREIADWLLRGTILASVLVVAFSSFLIANDVARGRWT